MDEYETQVHAFDSGIDAANTLRLAYSAMRFASQCVGPADMMSIDMKDAMILHTCSSVMESSFKNTLWRPSFSSSSSSSSSSIPRPAGFRRLPNAALLPASENGVDATAVPKTLAVFGAPNAAKSVTTFLGGECAVDVLANGLGSVDRIGTAVVCE